MGFLDDVISGAGRGASAVAANTAPGRFEAVDPRMQEIQEFAVSQGYPLGPNMPGFARAFPELASEYRSLESQLPMLSAGIGTGAMGAAGRAAANAAPAAPRPPAGGPFLGPSTAPPPTGGQFLGPSAPPPAPPAPAGGPFLGPSTAPPPTGGQFLGPHVGPTAQGATRAIMPPASPAPGFLQQVHAAAQKNPIGAAAIGAVGAVGAGLVGAGIGAATDPNNVAAKPSEPPHQPELTPGFSHEQNVIDARRAADERRAAQRNAMDPQQLAQLQEIEALTAKANAERAEMERRFVNSNLDDKTKEEMRAALEKAIHDRDNDAAAARAAAGEAGATARNAAQIGSAERIAVGRETGENTRTQATIESNNRNTDVRETGENTRTGIREAGENTRAATRESGENTRTATRETGENTRTGFRGQVEQRGQDEQARAAKYNFVVQLAANLLKSGEISERKAHDMIQDAATLQKLPSEILNNVTASMDRLLPYRRNGNVGDAAPDQAAGSRLAKAAGGKGSSKGAGYSSYDPWEEAKAMSGTPATAPAPIDMNQVYSQVPDTSPAALEAAGSRALEQYGAPSPQIQMPAAIQSVMQPATPPMPEDAQQRIYNQIGTK